MNLRNNNFPLEKFNKTGVSFPISVLDLKELIQFQNSFEDFESIFDGRPTAQQMKQLHLFFPWAYQLVTHPGILNIIEQILGPDIIVHSSSIFCKYPNDPSFVSWHQDGFYLDLNKSKLVSAWVALSNSTSENGCLRVMPGTHLKKYKHKEEYQKNNMLTTGLTIGESMDESVAVEIELQAGELSLHHVNIIHGSNPNSTENKRIGFAIRYITPDVCQKLTHYDVVLVRGEDQFHHYNLMKSIPEGTLKECQKRQATFHENYLKEREKQITKVL
ncbi:MAG: non-heme Fe2+,alpha-ketoglutarate-dependent halogenase [Saprospiraceae bacterium]|jgi:non-heme Fe2+,alpha-ketoglutarate-dependent halogenase